jgi:protein-L-isoaspartate(D-aspartate) O-methyltransferase
MHDYRLSREAGATNAASSLLTLSRHLLRNSLLLLHDQTIQMPGFMRDRLQQQVGALIAPAAVRIVGVVLTSSATDLMHFIHEPGPSRVATLDGVVPETLTITGGNVYGGVSIAECAVGSTGQSAWLVFSGDDSLKELVILEATDDDASFPDHAMRYTAAYTGDDPVGLALRAVPRSAFLTQEFQARSGEDRPFAIGHGQNNSQPSVVAFMLRLLGVGPGNSVLDVGSGSGWTAGLLAHLTGPTGQVFATELIPELREMGSQNCRRFNDRVQFLPASRGTLGAPEFGPYDRILVSAGRNCIPRQLVEQLSPNGVLVMPVNAMITVTTMENGQEHRAFYAEPGFGFVPLV